MKINKIVMVIIGLVTSFTLSNANASWIDWTSTTTGTIMVNGTTANVSLTGPAYAAIDGDYYYNNANTGGVSPSGTYAGLAPSDLIQVVNGTGTFTLTFDQAIVDPYMALVSVGQPNYGVTYSFNDPFTVVSAGSNYWGYGSYSVNNNDFTGYEYNGILQFSGSFTSISFSVNQPENWHGFNFGMADRMQAVPEPASWMLLSGGLIGLIGFRKKLSRG